jgi:hypothetical protein
MLRSAISVHARAVWRGHNLFWHPARRRGAAGEVIAVGSEGQSSNSTFSKRLELSLLQT